MKKIIFFLLSLFLTIGLVGCVEEDPSLKQYERLLEQHANYDNYYHLFVRSFADSDGDGIGDLNGITQNLDYFVNLGITALWLLPIHPSPTYHGYDVVDYYAINEDYGTMDDFDNLVSKANEKGIKIVLDLVINHTSDQHPWYLDSKNSDSQYHKWYKIDGQEVRSFVGGMVDLNLELEEVKQEIFSIADFYLDKGVSGFRLDAAKHFFEGNPNELSYVTKNIIFTNELRIHIKEKNPNAFLVSEIFIGDYNLTKEYYLANDSLFDFYLKDEIHNKVGTGNSTYLIVNNIIRAYNEYRDYNPDFINAIFLSNHDIDRMASLRQYQNESSKSRYLQSINYLLTLPGSPYIYYGDELGMRGSRYEGDVVHGKVVYDEYRRQPFLWNDDSKLTTWLASDGSNDDVLRVEDQMNDSTSLYNYYKILTNLRKDNIALRFGNDLIAYKDNNSNIQGYIRHFEFEDLSQTLLILHNMSEKDIEITLDYNKVIYGNTTIEGNGMLILEIDANKIGDYS